ncbi:MAG: hypothetical protein EKK39_14810 [Sphingobacteriales bacterium]|nr:MAG: hypothetical protein EKK39_14810 [Sphingobacteriales bacterium]
MQDLNTPYTPLEEKVLIEMYSHTLTGIIAEILDRSFMDVHEKAMQLHLEKNGVFKNCMDNLHLKSD